MHNEIFRVYNEKLDDDKCLLTTMINISENIFIQDFMLILERHNDIVKIDLAGVFSENNIRMQTLHENEEKEYEASTCSSLMPLVKTLSWRNPELIVTDFEKIKNSLAKIALDLEKNICERVFYYENKDIAISNILSARQGWALKTDRDRKFFMLHNNKISFFSLDQVRGDTQKTMEDLLEIILGHVRDDD